MRFSRSLRPLLACLLVTAAMRAAAQTPTAAGPALVERTPAPVPPATVARAEDGRISIRAVRLDQPLALDGALDEDIYRTTPPVTDFVQQFPRGGEPATEDTEVWIFFDNDTLYAALRCHDSRPDQMVANEMRRDHLNIWQNDNVIVVLDTFYDRRSGYFFQTNPLGGVREALVIDETTTNYDWNAVWDVKSRRTEGGWTTEMAIPFKSLRYKPAASQVWGFQVMRVVRSKNEQTLLAGVPRTYGGQGYARLASAATLVGIEAPAGSRNLELKAYAISNLSSNRPAGISNDLDGALGIDAKYGLTSSLTADFTYNTDFAQVEIDEQQVNLTRFSLFFPEKRDFFLEGQGIFDFAGSGARRATAAADTSPIMFFSRRIGLNGGRPVAIEAGGRLMGRAGRMSMGVLNIQTEDAPEANALGTNFSVVRVKRDVFRRSSIGMILTNRRPSAPGGGSNQVYGVDANLVFFENVRLNTYYAQTATTRLKGDTESYRGQFQYTAERYGFEVQRLKVGNAFNPEVGFLPRDDFRRTFVLARFSPRPKNIRGLRKLTWEATVDRYVNSADRLETQQDNGAFRVEFNSSDLLTVEYFRNYEYLAQPFTVAAGVAVPVGEHRFQELLASYALGPQRTVSGTLTFRRGGFYTGDRTQIGYAGRVKLNAQLAVEPRASVDWVDLPQGHFRITLLGLRPTYTMTPRMFVSALVQYNSGTRTLETNARWRWEYEPGSDLFVVYSDGRETSRRGFPELLNRGIAVKLTRFLRF